MLKSLTKLFIAGLRLISTLCRLLTTFGCYHPASSSSLAGDSTHSSSTSTNHLHSNGVSKTSNGHINGYCNGNGTIANGATPHTNGTAKLFNGTIPNGTAVKNGHGPTSGRPQEPDQQENGHVLHQHKAAPLTVRPQVPLYMIASNYLCHGTLFLFGHLNDFLRRHGLMESLERVERNREGYASLYSSFATFYIRNIIQRMIDMWCHPISSVPGAEIEILERKYNAYNAVWKYTGRTLKAINCGSYNYLGYAENKGPRIEAIQADIPKFGVGLSSAPNEMGTFDKFVRLEAQVAQFLGVEDSVVVGMGFATNALCLPCLFGPGCLAISDQHNHASLALGCKLSGAKVRVFKHNDMKHLERLLREAIFYGQPAQDGSTVLRGEPWKKIIIIVEGIYSMEGTIVNLPEVIRLKKHYKAYLYMDEAHSIGAMGPRGRGICDYYGCDPRDVDLLMGTFTKSFAAAGGYIAGSKSTINYIRSSSPSFYYCTTMAPPVVHQISYILEQFLAMDKNNNRGKAPCDVQQRIAQLRKNTNLFRQKLKQLGFHIDGDDDSPVVPIMVYSPALLKCLIRELLTRGIASTGAAFPVTSLIGIRARFCLSASHTDEMIERIIESLDEIGEKIGIKFDANKKRTVSSM